MGAPAGHNLRLRLLPRRLAVPRAAAAGASLPVGETVFLLYPLYL